MQNFALVLSDEDGNSVSTDLEQHFSPSEQLTPAAINVENSSDVIIGPVTQFHGPVTIYQKDFESTILPEIASPKVQLNGKLIKSESTSSDTSPPSQPEHPTKKFYSQHLKYVVITFLVLITLGVVTTVIVLSVKSDPEEPTFNPNTNHDDVDDGDDVLKPAGPGLIINKKKWGGRPALNWTKPLSHPIPYVIISHTVTPQCKDFDACSRRVQSIQTYHVGGGKSPDIGYNFLIGGDGNAYVGRGWDIQNFHKNNSLGISFIGNYVYDYLTSNMIDVTKKLLDEGVKSGKISKTYVLVAHNQTYATESPGSHVYEVIKNWPHFSPERLL